MDEEQRLLMATVVPDGVYCSEQVGALWGSLLAAEAELLGPRTVSKRRQEFAAGRTCARAALELAGIPQRPLVQGEQHQPLWPDGITGSITHCRQYCAAAVAHKKKYLSLGVDAEPNQALPSGVLELIARDCERDWILKASDQDVCWDHLLFSMKESVYKAWYPLERCWLGFDEAEIEIDARRRTFQATLLRAISTCPRVIEGAFYATGSLLLTCAFVPAPFANLCDGSQAS